MYDIDQQSLNTQSDTLMGRIGEIAHEGISSGTKWLQRAALAGAVAIGSTGCASMSDGQNALLGAGTGAAFGNLIANSTKGTLVGAAVGAAGGAIISHTMERDLELVAQGTDIEINRISDGQLEITAPNAMAFGFDQDHLAPAFKSKLEEISRVLDESNGDHIVVFEGHTDRQGPEAYNQDLSERRASAMASYLTQVAAANGQDPATTILTAGLGESEANHPDPQRNREGKIVVLAQGDDARQYLQEMDNQQVSMNAQ